MSKSSSVSCPLRSLVPGWFGMLLGKRLLLALKARLLRLQFVALTAGAGLPAIESAGVLLLVRRVGDGARPRGRNLLCRHRNQTPPSALCQLVVGSLTYLQI